jgi:CBS domain-containing protein
MAKRITIEEIMTSDVFTVTLDDTVRAADDLMRTEKIRHVPVIDDQKLIGLITERTIMQYTLKQLYDYDDNYGESSQNRVGDFEELMVKNLKVIFPEDSLLKAVELMTKYKIDCLPVVDWKHNLVGILTNYDVLLFIHKKLLEELTNI